MLTRRLRFLHIQFADKLNLSARPVNFAPTPGPQVDAPEFVLQGEDREFMTWLLNRAGVSATHYRAESLARRLPACLRVLRANSAAHARAIVERNHELLAPAISAVLIGVTSFFRDTRVFDDLDALVLAPLAERASARIWSVGCSDGMELYSVAMLLAERRVLHRCHLLGTDCRGSATRFAATGIYPRQTLSDVPQRLRDAYLKPLDAHACAIHPIIRAQIQWRTADVLTTGEPGPWDLILCRNMAMYMRADAVVPLWADLHRALRPGGYLVLGKAERPTGIACLTSIAPCIYRRER